MTNPLLTFTGKDVLVLYLLAQGVAVAFVTAALGGLWGLSHFEVWR
jgi:hypothetical protein